MPNAGRSLGPNLGSATRLCLAHSNLEEGVDAPPGWQRARLPGIDGKGPRWRPLPMILSNVLMFLAALMYWR
eukprot:5021670-Alexandrium_andersonii.AAC.1